MGGGAPLGVAMSKKDGSAQHTGAHARPKATSHNIIIFKGMQYAQNPRFEGNQRMLRDMYVRRNPLLCDCICHYGGILKLIFSVLFFIFIFSEQVKKAISFFKFITNPLI
jgi:hypothetical protein